MLNARGAFIAADRTILHRYTVGADLDAASGRGIELLTPVWNLLDLTPEGRGDWYPSHSSMPPTAAPSTVSGK